MLLTLGRLHKNKYYYGSDLRLSSHHCCCEANETPLNECGWAAKAYLSSYFTFLHVGPFIVILFFSVTTTACHGMTVAAPENVI